MFKDIELNWKGTAYPVKHDRVMRLIAAIEDHIRIQDLANPDGPPLSKLAMGYSAALRYAGLSITSDEVYAEFFSSDAAGATSNAVTSLLVAMLPPKDYAPEIEEQDKKKAKKTKKG